MSKRYKVKRFSSCYLMNWVDNKTNKELTALEIEEILHKQEKRIAELQKQLEEKEKEIKEINNYPIKLNIKPYIFTAKYECWSIRQKEDKHKYLILIDENGKLKPVEVIQPSQKDY